MTGSQECAGRRWTASEDQAITAPGAMGRLAEIAASLGRTYAGAQGRRRLLRMRWGGDGCRNPLADDWTAREDSVLRSVVRLYPRRLPNGAPDALSVVLPGRTPGAIKARLSMMRRNHEQ